MWLAQLLQTLTPEHLDLLVVFESSGELAELAVQSGHRAEALNPNGLDAGDDLSKLAARLAIVLRDEEPPVTIHWSPRSHVYGSEARQLAGCGGSVAWVQHVISSDFWLHERANSLPADAVVCVSEAVATANRRLYPKRRTVILHPGVDVGSVAILDPALVRSDLGVPRDARIVAVVGRIEPWKGQDVMIRALRVLRDQGIEAHGLLVGEPHSATWPDFAGEIKALTAELDLTPYVTYTGHLREPVEALSIADVLVCSSREEGFSLAVAEAMSVEVPVVATRCGGPEDLITTGVDGLLVPIDDPTAMAGAVTRLLNDKALAIRIATSARSTWTRRFTAAHSADRFRALVQGLVAGS